LNEWIGFGNLSGSEKQLNNYMPEFKEEFNSEELRKKALLMAARLKSSGLDSESVYARLEKDGIPEDMARKITSDVFVQTQRAQRVREAKADYEVALIRVGIGLVGGLLLYLIMPNPILPIGIVAGGIISALWALKRMNE
jgi:hypothetical protein